MCFFVSSTQLFCLKSCFLFLVLLVLFLLLQTARQMASKKYGSFHFKMAMVCEEGSSRPPTSTNNSSTGSRPSSHVEIFREVLGEDTRKKPVSSATKSTSTKDESNSNHTYGSQESGTSVNPWILMLGREKTTSTIRSADIKPQSPNFQGITTACFKDKNMRGTGMKNVKDPLASDVKQVGSKTYGRTYGGNVNLNGRVSLSSTRAVNLTFRQSADPTTPTFAGHFRQTGNAHRLIRFSNLKYTLPNAIYGKILGQGGTAKTHTNKSVTFRKSKTGGPSLGRGSAETKDWTVARTFGVQAPRSDNFSSKSPQKSQAHENAVRRYRDIRNIKDNEQPDFAITRKSQATYQTKRKMLRRPTVTATLKQSKDTGIITSKGGASAGRKSVTMAGRSSTASMENLRTQLEQAKLTGSSEGSRNGKSQCSCEAQENEAACSDNTTRRFSTTDEGYDTTHSIEGDSPSHRKLPDMAPPIITHSPGRNPAKNGETVSKTMKALKLKKL